MRTVTIRKCAWVFALALAACGQSAESDSPPPTLPDAAPTVETPGNAGPTGPRLGARHPGWKQANCASCHPSARLAEIHGDPSPKQPACVSCHGWNGANHRDHAADPVAQCSSCHTEGAQASDHLAIFVEPRDCATCHVHPGSPTGE